METNTPKKILENVASHLNMTIAELSESIGYDRPQAFYDVINGKTKRISATMANKIKMSYPKFNLSWLLTGDGDMETQIMVSQETSHISVISLPMIPFDAVAGYDGLDHDGVILSKCVQYSIPDFSEKGAEFVIRVSGNSMYPKYSNGDILACRKVRDILFFQWGKDYVIDSSQGTMIKRVYEDKSNLEMIRLYSDNKEFYPEFVMPKSDIRSLSIVVGLIRTE